LWGTIICELAFVPRVPDSKSGLLYQTHLESTYSLALILSTAFTTKFRLSQNSSSKISSVSGPTNFYKSTVFKLELICLAMLQAV